jgi:hypothetical protein
MEECRLIASQNKQCENEKCMQNFSRKTLRKKPLERYMLEWEINVKTDHKKVLCGSVAWIQLAHDRTYVVVGF